VLTATVSGRAQFNHTPFSGVSFFLAHRDAQSFLTEESHLQWPFRALFSRSAVSPSTPPSQQDPMVDNCEDLRQHNE
jgi:hypothetical protein